jgi:hypothetical protein
MLQDISGFTMNELSIKELDYGKIDKFYFVTQVRSLNTDTEGSDFKGDYLLYERSEISKHRALYCSNPKSNIDLINHYYDLFKSDTVYLSSIKFYKDSVRLKLDRKLNQEVFIGWKLIVFKKSQEGPLLKDRESILNKNSVFIENSGNR